MGADSMSGTNGHSKQKGQSYARGTWEFAQRQVDRIVSPEARQKSYDATASFAVARPLLFVRSPTSPYKTAHLELGCSIVPWEFLLMGSPSPQVFLVSQLIFCALPVTLFLSFALSTAVFALVSAVVFTLFWVVIALLVLTPVLFFTSSLAILVWLWTAGTFLAGRWILRKLSSGDDATPESNKQAIYYKRQRQNGENGVKEEVADFKE
jgi:lysylphosphatidylglycerol synthetase-like protein (DUF2156 family)